MDEENPLRRERLARFAAIRLLPGRHSSARTSGYSTLDSSVAASEEGGTTCCVYCASLRSMTLARRAFSLIVAFDLILAFILWGIQVKTRSDESLTDNFINEVVHYNIKTSLFDTFICGLMRFIPLTVAYALCYLRNPAVIAVTTFVTCVFVVTKVFVFVPSVLGYVIFVEQFVIAWVETWLLDFKVFPIERKLEDGSASGSTLERGGRAAEGETDSPFHTPQEGSSPSSPGEPNSYEDASYRRIAAENWQKALRLVEMMDGWKVEMETADRIRVWSRRMDNLGQVLRIEARVEASPEDVFRVTSLEYKDSLRWDKTAVECRILQVLGPNTDITYNVTAEAGKGVVSSRDFVTVRHWQPTDRGSILSAACAVEHPFKPIDKRYVRGENRISAFVYEGDVHGTTQLRIYVSTDIKGWIPQVVVDQALTGVLVEFVRCLRTYIKGQTSYQGQVVA